MGNKNNGSFFAGVGNAAKGVLDKAKDKAINVADQNADGRFDMSDVSIVADALGDAMKRGAAAVLESAEENRKRIDLKLLQPIFPTTLDQADFLMSKLIRVAD